MVETRSNTHEFANPKWDVRLTALLERFGVGKVAAIRGRYNALAHYNSGLLIEAHGSDRDRLLDAYSGVGLEMKRRYPHAQQRVRSVILESWTLSNPEVPEAARAHHIARIVSPTGGRQSVHPALHPELPADYLYFMNLLADGLEVVADRESGEFGDILTQGAAAVRQLPHVALGLDREE